MTFLKKTTVALAALSMVAAPVAASAAPAANFDDLRISSEMDREMGQSGGFPFLIVFVVVAVGLGIYFAVDGDDEPTSP